MSFLRLRVRMLERGLRQRDLARIAGCSSSTITQRLRGEQPWTAREMSAIGRALDIPREEYGAIFFDEEGRA